MIAAVGGVQAALMHFGIFFFPFSMDDLEKAREYVYNKAVTVSCTT